MTNPSTSRPLRADATGALLVAIVCLLLMAFKWPFFGIGGATNAGAIRILDGQIPYRDFWTLYAPGSFYVHALLLKLFGMHMLVEHIAGSVITALGCACCYLLVQQWLQRTALALACAAVFSAASIAVSYHLTLGPYPQVILLILLTLLMIVRYYRGAHSGYLIAAGLLNGLAILVKHDVAGYTGLSIAAGLLVWHLFEAPAGSRGWRPLLSAWLAYGLSAALVVVPVTVWFALRAGPDMLQDLLLFPLREFRFARMEVYPSLLPPEIVARSRSGIAFQIFSYFVFLWPFLLASFAAVVLAGKLVTKNYRHLAFGCTLVLLWFFHYSSAHVQINTNFISMALYAVLLGALLYELVSAGRFRLPAWFAALVVLAWCAILLIEPSWRLVDTWQTRTAVIELPRVSGMRTTPAIRDEIMYVADYIERDMKPGEELFLALHRHDVTVVSNAGLYFILGMMNPTRHDQLHPGIVERADYQQGIIRDLEERAVPVIVMQHIFGGDWLENIRVQRKRNLPQTGATDLDEYIRAHYEPVGTRQGALEIWRRRGVPAGP